MEQSLTRGNTGRGYLSAVVAGLTAAAMLLCTGSAAAEQVSSTRVLLDSQSADSVFYTIESESAYENAIVMAVAYSNGRLADVNTETLDIAQGTYSDSAVFDTAFDETKIFLLDGSTYAPICMCGKKCNVVFHNCDGTVLLEQTALSGHAVGAVPAAPEKDGCYFTGWDRDYSRVFQDEIITAQYVNTDAPNIFLVSAASGNPGDEITVSVKLAGSVSLCGFDMKLNYDADILEFVGLDNELSMDVVANHPSGSSSIRFNFSSNQNKLQGGDVLNVTFKIKDTARSYTPVKLLPVSVISTDADNSSTLVPVEYTVTEGMVFIG